MKSDYENESVDPYHPNEVMSEEQVKCLLNNTRHCFACQLHKKDCRQHGCRELALVGLAFSGGGVYDGGNHGDASKIVEFFEEQYLSWKNHGKRQIIS